MFVLGLLLGVVIGAFGMGLMSAKAYNNGLNEGRAATNNIKEV